MCSWRFAMTWGFKQSVVNTPRSVSRVDFGESKTRSAKKLGTRGHHGQKPPDSRTESTRNGECQATEYRRGCAGTDGPPGRLPGVGEAPSGPRNEDMGAGNGPQGTQAAPQLIRSAPGRAEPRPATVESQEPVQRPWWRRVLGRRTE